MVTDEQWLLDELKCMFDTILTELRCAECELEAQRLKPLDVIERVKGKPPEIVARQCTWG